MGRYKLTIEYDGTRYNGWQMQKGGKSIQGEILDACRELFNSEVKDVFGAGRTDAGVHATGQVAHIDVETELPLLRIKYGINDRLPPDITILNVETTDKQFHARHDAVARSYLYQISRRRTAFGKKYVWWIKDPLDIGNMNKAAHHLIGLKNFRNFTDPEQEQGSFKTNIMHAEFRDYGDLILFHVIGSHFLWKQVRRMTGVLVETGRGKIKPDDVASYLHGITDIPAKLTAPPSGLFLDRVFYSQEEISYDASPVFNIR